MEKKKGKTLVQIHETENFPNPMGWVGTENHQNWGFLMAQILKNYNYQTCKIFKSLKKKKPQNRLEILRGFGCKMSSFEPLTKKLGLCNEVKIWDIAYKAASK